MRRYDHRIISRDVRRLLLSVGWVTVVVGDVVALLVRDFYNYTLVDRVFIRPNEYGYKPALSEAEPWLLVSVVALLAVGSVLAIFGVDLVARDEEGPIGGPVARCPGAPVPRRSGKGKRLRIRGGHPGSNPALRRVSHSRLRRRSAAALPP